jgi:pyruvate kinase
MALYWGVKPLALTSGDTQTDEIESALRAVQVREQLANGSRVVVTGGRLTKTPGATSVMEVREMNYR